MTQYTASSSRNAQLSQLDLVRIPNYSLTSGFHAMLTLHCNISGHNSVHRVQSTAYIRAQYSAIGMYCNNEQRLIGSEKIRLWMHCNVIIASLCEKGLEVQQKTVQRKTDKHHIADGGIGLCDWQVDAIQKSTRQHYHPPHIQFPWLGTRMLDETGETGQQT